MYSPLALLKLVILRHPWGGRRGTWSIAINSVLKSWLLNSQSGTFGRFHRQKMFLIQLNKMKWKPGGMLPVKYLLLLSSCSHPSPHYHNRAHQARTPFLMKMFPLYSWWKQRRLKPLSFMKDVSDIGAPKLPGKAGTSVRLVPLTNSCSQWREKAQSV